MCRKLLLAVWAHICATFWAADLIPPLGSDLYSERHQATLRLIELEDDAIPAVRAGMRNPDLEIRERCRDILVRWYYVFDGHSDVGIFDIGDQPVALRYYLEAYNQGHILEGWEYANPEVEHYALWNYMADRMDHGMSRQQAVRFIEQCAERRAKVLSK